MSGTSSGTSSPTTCFISARDKITKRKQIQVKNGYLAETMEYFEFDEFVEAELARWIKYKTEPKPHYPTMVTEFSKARYKAFRQKLIKLFA